MTLTSAEKQSRRIADLDEVRHRRQARRREHRNESRRLSRQRQARRQAEKGAGEMTIYNRWGDELTIVANHGEVMPPEFVTPVTLVKVNYGPGSENRFQFADFLKATDGWPEIKSAVDALPVSKISASAMKSAIKQAM